jgi:retron-type reverse transcriptase
VGLPLGSILSPILCNIYINELDVFINNLITEYTKGKTRRKNQKYRKLQNQMGKACKVNDTKEILKIRENM